MDTQISISDQVFFHGTNADFNQFDLYHKGSNTEYSNTVHGFFFADKEENALLFGQRIIKARLTINNPINFTIQGIFTIESQASTIWEIVSGEKLSNLEALNKMDDEIGLGEIAEFLDLLNTEEAHNILIEKGYDGIISSLGNEQLEYVVFCDKQIELLAN